MAAIDVQKLTANLSVTQYPFAPAATTPTDVAWVDFQMFEHFLAGFHRTVGTGNLTQMSILGNSAANGSGTDVTIVSKTFSGQPDAKGDYVWLETTAQEIAQRGAEAGEENLRYVSVNITLATGTDEGVVTYIREPGRFAYQALTSDLIQ